jgi:nitric-oxide synthase, bacterial
MNSDVQIATPPTLQQFITPDNLLAPSSHFSSRSNKALLAEAQAYLRLYYHENGVSSGSMPTITTRSWQVQQSIEQTGTYCHTMEELAYGARVAWRNNTRCIGRLHWKMLTVRDMRHLVTAQEIFRALVEHIRTATNGGKIRSLLTVFAPQEPGEPGIRIWNPQLIRYACYKLEDGSIIGDPLQLHMTEKLLRLGWKGGRGSHFDLLPLVIQMPGQEPEMFELPEDCVLEVPISHPDYSWFEDLDLKWHALPVISNMRMEIGGISYTAAPFNGWYMGAEIGARNFGDEQRYNILPIVAEKMGLNIHRERTLWKDRALVEMNVAVLHSFAKHGVTIVDHHTASRQLVRHEERECQAGRLTPADWGWIVPPLSGSTTPVFHRHYENTILVPNFFYQSSPWYQYSI